MWTHACQNVQAPLVADYNSIMFFFSASAGYADT